MEQPHTARRDKREAGSSSSSSLDSDERSDEGAEDDVDVADARSGKMPGSETASSVKMTSWRMTWEGEVSRVITTILIMYN